MMNSKHQMIFLWKPKVRNSGQDIVLCLHGILPMIRHLKGWINVKSSLQQSLTTNNTRPKDWIILLI